MLTVVIPTLNAATHLPTTLRAVAAGADEIVVVDGGSSDATVALAEAHGARVLGAARGRGTQLAVGGRAARGDWLLFLHADTVLAPDWIALARRFMADPANTRRAAAFRFALDDDSPEARRLEAMVAWRCRMLGLPYGDQGLLIPRAFYDQIGGYRPLPLMEDVDLIRRVGRRNVARLDARAITSAARFRSGYAWRSARNLACLALYFAGLPTPMIARLYR